jgi:hypothetical protein
MLFNKDGPSVKGLWTFSDLATLPSFAVSAAAAAASSLRFSYASPSKPVGENSCPVFTAGVTDAPDAFLLLDIFLLS